MATDTAKTVNSAFTSFRKNIVDLDSDVTSRARISKDWLYGKLKSYLTMKI